MTWQPVRARKRARIVSLLILCMALPLGIVTAQSASADKPQRYSVLLFKGTAGFSHPSIPAASAAIEQLGEQRGFDVVQTTDAASFTSEELSKYAAVVFLHTTGNVLPQASQRQALENYVRSGGGWFGIHAAADMGGTVRNGWPWYRELVGGAFKGHTKVHVWADTAVSPSWILEGTVAEAPEEAEYFQAFRVMTWEPARVEVEDPSARAMRGFGTSRVRADEWYGFLENPRPKVHVLASLDESSYDPGPGDMGPDAADHPIAWCRDYDGGRSIYTGMGHPAGAWSEWAFMKHIEGAIEMAAGVAPFNCDVP